MKFSVRVKRVVEEETEMILEVRNFWGDDEDISEECVLEEAMELVNSKNINDMGAIAELLGQNYVRFLDINEKWESTEDCIRLTDYIEIL